MKRKIKSKKIYSQITYWLGVVAVGLAVGLSIQFVVAWVEPTAAPPGDNLEAPLNVSDNFQSKKAGLMLNTSGISADGLIVANGNVGIGTTSPTQRLDVNGYVKGRSGLCIGNDCRNSWPSGGGSSGDITAVYAGTGLKGGGTSGNVTLSMKDTTKSCGPGKAIRSFNLNSTSSPTCISVGGGGGGGGGITGSGATNYLPKWTGSTSLGNSSARQSGNNILTSGNLSINNLGGMPNGWSGLHTFDVHARGSIRTHALCLGGGFGGSGVGDCRTSWPSGGGSPACTFCRETCGGNWPKYQGKFYTDDDNNLNYMEGRESGCKGPIKRIQFDQVGPYHSPQGLALCCR